MSATDSTLQEAAAARPGCTTFALPSELLRLLSAKMPEGVNVLVVPPDAVQAEFIRLPKAGQNCPVTGLPRSSLVNLIKDSSGKIKTHKLRAKGSLAGGQVLINRRSLVDYIEAQPAAEWSPTATQPET